MKKVLAFVSGMSPAIITETIYALATSEEKWVADEIYIYTTQTGKRQVEEQLLHSGVYAEMCNTLGIDSTKHNIEVVKYCGEELDDIRTKEDNDNFANFIVSKIHNLCSKKNNQVYISLAGGRKTMSYYMGYSLSLFGREQDKLFHVLVSEPFDGGVAPNFYYPKDANYSDRAGKQFNGKEAKLELAEIPFISLRNFIPEQFEKNGNFNEYIQSVNTQLDKRNQTLAFDFENSSIICNGVAIRLERQELALYYHVAEALVNNDEAENSIILPDITPKNIYNHLKLITKDVGASCEKFSKTYPSVKTKNKDDLASDKDKLYSNIISNKSSIQKKIKQTMKDAGFHHIWHYFLIQEVGKLGEHTLFSLNLEKENITLP